MLPPRSATAKAEYFSTSTALRGRLNGVSLANRGSALSLMREILREFNATPLGARERLSMLGVFEDATAALVDDARNETREFFPMSAERIEDALLASAIERELALGYVAVVCDLCAPAGKVKILHRGMVAEALVRACLHQNARLWLASRMHCEPDAGTWQGLHDMFRFAVASGCADKAEVTMAGDIRAGVRSIYAQALLHAFARPNHFTQKQNRQLHTSLPVLASWCDVGPGHALAGTIAVYAKGDATPPTLPRSGPIDGEDCWLLDVSTLIAQLDSLLAARGRETELHLRAKRGGAQATLAADTVEVLRRVWSARIERASARSPDDIVFETEVGLASLHGLLLGEQEVEFALSLAGEVSTSAASWATRVPADKQKQRARAQVVDSSRHGYRLHWRSGEDARVRVGELIAVAPVEQQQDERQWTYGALRWLRADPKVGVDAGVELLPSTPIAVAVYVLDAGGRSGSPVRGILFNADTTATKRKNDGAGEASIWVPRPFAPGNAVLEVARFSSDVDEVTPRPVRVAQFTVRDEGLYQKIQLPEEILARIVGPATDATASSG